MEFRKLIGFGKSSLVISIPKSWTQRHKLAKGNLVYLNEEDDNLVLSTRERKLEKNTSAIVISSDGKSLALLEAEIIAAYLTNYNIIEVKGDDLKEKGPHIKTILQNLAGIELLDQTATKIVAKDLMDLKELSIETIVRRIDIIVRSMFQDFLSGDLKYADSIVQRDKDVNRLVFLIKRVIHSALKEHEIARSLKRKNEELLRDWLMISLLESIGDEVKRISRLLKSFESDDKSKKAILEIASMLNRVYLELMKAYHTNNQKIAFEAEVNHKQRVANIEKLVKNFQTYEGAKLAHHINALESSLKNISRLLISS